MITKRLTSRANSKYCAQHTRIFLTSWPTFTKPSLTTDLRSVLLFIHSVAAFHQKCAFIYRKLWFFILDLLCDRAAQFNDKSQLGLVQYPNYKGLQSFDESKMCQEMSNMLWLNFFLVKIKIMTQKWLFLLIFHLIMLTISCSPTLCYIL